MDLLEQGADVDVACDCWEHVIFCVLATSV